MSFSGLLRQTVTVRPVVWTGTTSTDGVAVDYPARVEQTFHTVSSELGDTVRSRHVAYLPATATVTADDVVVYGSTNYRAVCVTPVVGGDGTTHHYVVDLATLDADSVSITRPVGPADWDPATGLVNQQPPVLVWSGPATISPSTGHTRRDVAGQDVRVVELDVLVTHHTPDLFVGDVVTVTASDDPHLIGVALRVDSISAGSSQYGQHLLCIDDRTNQ